jgi:hypothetical protein
MSTREELQHEFDALIHQLSSLEYKVLCVERDDYLTGAELAIQIEDLKNRVEVMRWLLNKELVS